ncbi:MAG: ribosome assembly cofactor RimP [Bacteroidetes bacterium]|nr:ribosome assembly cofactor RimP [Bacteroidota bacterium]
MISAATIHDIVLQKIADTSVFLVDVKVKHGNKIEVFIDEPKHITIDTCREISKHIEANLNRDEEDFELTVSSPGIDEPFTVLNQYLKYQGKQVSVLKKDGEKLFGALLESSGEIIILQTKKTERKKLGKGKQTVIENILINTEQIKETKLILPF